MASLNRWILFSLFELGLAALACLGQWAVHGTGFEFHFNPLHILSSTLPLLAFGWFATSWGLKWKVFRRIAVVLKSSALIRNFIRRGTPAVFLIVSICAGLGEELLFRGFLQPMMGVWLTALIFGLMHALSWGYFFIAFVLGLFFGFFVENTQDLTAVIVAHAMYDFLILILYQRRFRT